MARLIVSVLVTIFVAFVTHTLSMHINGLDDDVIHGLEDKKIGIPTEDLLRALESQYGFGEGPDAQGRAGASLFNLSAYLTTNTPNTTAVTFIPLITLLFGLSG